MSTARALFEFEVPAAHIKTFAAAVTALSAVGKEVCLGVSPARSGDQVYMTLSAYDDAATAFGTFRFEERFFTRARARRASGEFACKILARTLFPALKRATARCHAGSNTGAPPRSVPRSTLRGGLFSGRRARATSARARGRRRQGAGGVGGAQARDPSRRAARRR